MDSMVPEKSPLTEKRDFFEGEPETQIQLRGDVFRSILKGLLRRLYKQLSSPRSWLLAGMHVIFFAAAYWGAYLLRFGFNVSTEDFQGFLGSVGLVLVVQLAVFSLLGQFHGWWRYVTFADFAALLCASVISLFALTTVSYFIPSLHIPRGVLAINFMLLVGMLCMLRASWRMFREVFQPILNGGDSRQALLVGTDLSNGILAHQIQSHYHLPYRIRGFLSTDDHPADGRLGRIRILGKLDDIQEIASMYRATDVLVVAGSLPGAKLRWLMDQCEEGELKLKIIRSLEDRLEGDNRVPIRDIEINDLLRRDPVSLDTENIGKLLEGRRVLVTGAGGSIGSEICRQIIAFHPQSLVLLGRGENRIFAIENELKALRSSTAIHPSIVNVTNREHLEQIFQAHQPEVVFHAAAHKHVPLMEANVGEAIRNNVLGTKCVADLADQFGVRSFVLVSTDKAVNPTSVMGVTKQIAERYVHTLSQESATSFIVVRFGNVLGSNGSVVPLFQDQVRRGGPITVTDPRMTRFFMTIPEASQLVIQAATMGSGGEIFVLEMGEQVKIVDLARDLIRLSGLPENSIDIVYTGVRPGEKLYEELYFEDEQTLPTSHPKLRAAYHRPYSLVEVRRDIAQLLRLVNDPEKSLRRKLREIVPEFKSPQDDTEEAGAVPVKLKHHEVKASA